MTNNNTNLARSSRLLLVLSCDEVLRDYHFVCDDSSLSSVELVKYYVMTSSLET